MFQLFRQKKCLRIDCFIRFKFAHGGHTIKITIKTYRL